MREGMRYGQSMAEDVVLIVDDETGVVLLCQRLLERAGFRAFTVTSPEDGLVILEQHWIDLLLVDIRMPGMNGFEMIERCRQKQPELAVVIMTGYGTIETAIEALRRGADGLILKPFSQGAELVQSVRMALEENRRKRELSRLQALRPLFDLGEALFSETNPKRLRDLVLDAICGHLHCSHAGLYYRAAGEACLTLLAGRFVLPTRDKNGGYENQLPWAESLGVPLMVSWQAGGEGHFQPFLEVHNLKSMMWAPVSIERGNYGFLAARSSEESPFSQADLEMMVILARQAAIALENARLYADLRAYVRKVEESQRALIQAEKMAAAGRLTASIAHEINNPLQAVQNCIHLAGRKELNSQQRENYLALAQSELDRLMATVQRMLDFYRPIAVDRKSVDINQLVQRVAMLLDQQLKKEGVILHTQLAPQLSPILGVGDQIQQVILNLMLNGMEAMPAGGNLFIETQQVGDEVHILVEDSGEGVSEADRERIFEPFLSTKEKGMGLGLSVSYGIISAHGGQLELVNGQGSGACFRVVIPIGGNS
jgi:signal transduction histidine kinase/FixJ family two-component response regulator